MTKCDVTSSHSVVASHGRCRIVATLDAESLRALQFFSLTRYRVVACRVPSNAAYYHLKYEIPLGPF